MLNGSSAVIFMTLAFVISLFRGVKPGKVFFVSDVRAELGGNLLDVYDFLGGSYERVTYLKADRRKFSSPCAFAKMVYDTVTSEVIFLEDYFRYTSYQKLRPGQRIYQLWHGAGAFKKFGYGRAGGNEKIRIHKGYRKYAGAIVSSEEIRGCYAEAFGIPVERVRATGVPRTDLFFDKDKVLDEQNAVYERYPMLKGKKVILFAPTYRGLRAEDAGYDFSRIDLRKFADSLDENYVFVFKWHPAVHNNILKHGGDDYRIDDYGELFLDLSAERDINALLLVTDILITDYSSVIFDYYFTGKPVVFYDFDRDIYGDGRGLYYPYEDYLYGPAVETQEDLIEAIRKEDTMPEKRETFGRMFLGACDGRSTEKVCRWVFGEKGTNR